MRKKDFSCVDFPTSKIEAEFMRKFLSLTGGVFLTFILTVVSPAFAEDLVIYPVFSAALDSPTFMVDYTNDTDHILVIPKLIEESSIIFDGLEYPLTVLAFGGMSNLRPGETWTYAFTLDSYISGAQKQGYDKDLNRWRWRTAIKPGKHTLALKFFGKESRPISFLWKETAPLLNK
jgi:hypothetical protein